MVKVINYRYPFDPYGANPECLIPKERHSLSAVSSASFALIVPKNGPFFRRGLVVKHISTDKKLTEGVDFALGHKFTRATVETARPVYGSILILNRELTGAFDVDYQTLGGEFVIDTQAALDALLNTQLDPRNTTWEAVIDVPPLFPPYEHYFDADNLVGAEALRQAILQVSNTIETMPEKLMPMLMLHLDDTGNPHRVDKTAVGLGNVDNFRTASVAETIEGMLNNRFVTPAGVRQLIASIISETVASHAARFDNPHHVSKDQVGLGNLQNYSTAVQADYEGSGAPDKYATPAGVVQAINVVKNNIDQTIIQHTGNKNNPHGTNKNHVGLGNVDNLKTAVATDYELANNSAFATPGLTVDWVKAYIATQAIIPVPVTGTTEVEVGKHYRVMAGANLIFPAEEGEIRIIIDHTVDVSTGSVVAVAPPNEVFHTSAGDDATVTLLDVGLEYIYQRINGAWRLS